MNILYSLFENMNLSRLKGKSSDQVINAFFANYCAALVLLKLHDLKGLMLINDKNNNKLTQFRSGMSDLNFWGKALFYSNDPEVKHNMLPNHADVLYVEAGRILTSRIQITMNIPNTAPDAINWNEVVASMILFKHRFGIKSSYFSKIVYTLNKWDMSSEIDKQQAVSNALMYLMQSDSQSALLPRFRTLSTSVLINTISKIAMKIVSFKRLSEEDVGTSTGNIASIASNITSNAIITPAGFDTYKDSNLGGLYSYKNKKTKISKNSNAIVKDGKIIKKKIKKFKFLKWQAPKANDL